MLLQNQVDCLKGLLYDTISIHWSPVQEQDMQTKTEEADKLKAMLKLESEMESVHEHAA